MRSTIPAINIIESNHGPFHKGERNKPIFFVYYIYSGYLFWIMHPTTYVVEYEKNRKKLVKCDDESIAWNLLLPSIFFDIFHNNFWNWYSNTITYILKKKNVKLIDLISFFWGLGSRLFKKLSGPLCFVVKDKYQSLILPTESLYSTRFLSKKKL